MPAAGARSRSKRRWLAVAGIAAFAVTAMLWGAFTREEAPSDPPATRLAVLFFKDLSPDGELAYLADGLTTTLINHLGGIRQIEVISQNGVRPFRGDSISIDSISRVLDVGTIVGGSLSQSGNRLRVTVEMSKAPSGVIIGTREFERPAGELFALLDDMSRELANFLRGTLGEEIQLRDWQAQTRSVTAWQLSQRAEYLRNSAETHSQAGNTLGAVQELIRADSLLNRAAALDSKWAEPWVMRGRIAERRAWLSFADERPPQPAKWLNVAAQHANGALRIDDRSAGALELRGLVSLLRMVLGSNTQAGADSLLRAAERDLVSALAVNPNMPKAESTLSAVYFAQGRFPEARAAALRALHADAYLKDADDIVNRLFAASFEVGDDTEAGYWCDEVRRRMPNRWPAAYCDLVLLGWGRNAAAPQKALLVLERFGADDPAMVRNTMRPRLTVLTAAVLARAGLQDSAQLLLRQARGAAPQDLELLPLEAGVRVQLGQLPQATALLEEYWKVNPSAKSRLVNSRMLRGLREQPAALARPGSGTTAELDSVQ
jgi:TolB-like protein